MIAPLPGRVEAILFEDGDLVRRGEAVIKLESMKMTLILYADSTGLIRYKAGMGEAVRRGELIAEINEPPPKTMARASKSESLPSN